MSKHRRHRGSLALGLTQVAQLYLMLAMLIFAGQSVFGNAGAIELIWPTVPIPIPPHHGRAAHLNLAIEWPVIGLMGLTYLFATPKVSSSVTKVALGQFVLVSLNFLGIIISLLLGYFGGGEYLEAPTIFKIGLLLALLTWFGNLARCYSADRSPGVSKVVTFIALVGIMTSAILLIPNIWSAGHPIIADALRFLVVHLWEEGSILLIASAIFAAIIASILQIPWEKIEPWLYLQGALVMVSAIFATSHHYYWLGTGPLWKEAGLVFSTMQVVPIAIIAYLSICHYQRYTKKLVSNTAIALLSSSVLWNVLGVAIMGYLISIPSINRYTHGTYITSSHAHLALFGVLGMIVLAGCSHGLYVKDPTWTRRQLLAVVLINAGLGTMGISLFFAGAVQAYTLRLVGLDFMTSHSLLLPYFVIRLLGGLVFAVGGVGLTFSLLYPFIKANGHTYLRFRRH